MLKNRQKKTNSKNLENWYFKINAKHYLHLSDTSVCGTPTVYCKILHVWEQDVA